MATIGFIGYRKQAIEAAKALGHRIIVWCDKLPPKKMQPFIDVLFIHDFTPLLPSSAIDLFTRESPDCFIAITESGVLPCAQLESHFHRRTRWQTAVLWRNKYAMKQRANQHAIPVTHFTLLEDNVDSENLLSTWGTPIYVKPCDSSGSRDLKLAATAAELDALKNHNLLAEQRIYGIEMSVEFFIQNKKIIFRNITQYYTRLEINIIPAPPTLIDPALVDVFIHQVMDAFELDNTIVHLECFITPHGLMFSEFAARPPGGYVMEAIAQAYGFNPWQTLIEIRLGLPATIKQPRLLYVAPWVYYPSPGKITEIIGEEDIKKLASLQSCTFKRGIGDIVPPRISTGQDVAKLVFVNTQYDHLIKDIERARSCFAFKTVSRKITQHS